MRLAATGEGRGFRHDRRCAGMPRAGWRKPDSEQRLSDHISSGVLTRTQPPWMVDAAVASAGRLEFRHRLLPARVVVYYVMALALFSHAAYEEVMRSLVEGLAWSQRWRSTTWTVPTKAAIFQARRRLGAEPLRSFPQCGATPGNAAEPWGLAPQLAPDEYRRHHPRCRRHAGERRRVRAATPQSPGAGTVRDHLLGGPSESQTISRDAYRHAQGRRDLTEHPEPRRRRPPARSPPGRHRVADPMPL